MSVTVQTALLTPTSLSGKKSPRYWLHLPLLRLLLAAPIAAGSTLILFLLMALMVDNGHQSKPQNSSQLVFDMFMAEQPKELQRRQRSVPEKPQTPPMPAAQSLPATTTTALPLPSMTNIGLDSAIAGLAVNIPIFSEFGANQQALPLYRVEPQYPSRALKLGAEGFVLLGFTIDAQGRPQDIHIKDSKPRRMFDKAALHALKKWKYQPKVVDGKSMPQSGQTVRLEFKISK